MRKRLLAFLLSLCMIFSLLPVTAFAAGPDPDWPGGPDMTTELAEQTSPECWSAKTLTPTWKLKGSVYISKTAILKISAPRILIPTTGHGGFRANDIPLILPA